ncbi:hypothetical protein GCM10009844_15270 [Nocardioides koreensis]|uniref:DUF3558 domain-containing protein n=1 Tax=Nocardioides koreensis TaxID=433651 RepID=A0ABN2ZJI8_9ACTN
MKLTLALAVLLLVAACGTDTADTVTDPATDPADSRSTAATPGAVSTGSIPPWVHGEVSTRTLATVMDTGDPELCLGPVAESYPPQCRGIPLKGWDWADQHGRFETSGDVRWGLFKVTGTFDGTTMTVSGAIPEEVYDALRDPERPEEPLPSGDAGLAGPQQQEIQRKVEAHPLPGTLSVYATPAAVVVEVVHDDGSLQEQVDAAYGAGVVEVRSMLVPVIY